MALRNYSFMTPLGVPIPRLAILLGTSAFALVGLLLVLRSNTGGGIRISQNKKYIAEDLPGISREDDVKFMPGRAAFQPVIESAANYPRRRKMIDLTKDAPTNTLQSLINTWTNGSYSPVHKHEQYSEAMVILDGALAFFTFSPDGSHVRCTVLSHLATKASTGVIVEKNQWHAMTVAPPSKGWPGHAVVFETKGYAFDPWSMTRTKTLAPFAPVYEDGYDGDPSYFAGILEQCPSLSQLNEA